MLEPAVEAPGRRRKLGLWLRAAAAVWVTVVGLWFAVITWPESAGVYLWLATPLVICLLSLAAARRNASRIEGWLYVAALAVLAALALAIVGDDLKQRRLLADMEKRGIRRRSASAPSKPEIGKAVKKRSRKT